MVGVGYLALLMSGGRGPALSLALGLPMLVASPLLVALSGVVPGLVQIGPLLARPTLLLPGKLWLSSSYCLFFQSLPLPLPLLPFPPFLPPEKQPTPAMISPVISANGRPDLIAKAILQAAASSR